jgi:glycosyltransferase involved in cell wall biosynthesis
VLRESLACGTPFVASRVGGIPEIATSPGCTLVPPGDPRTLAETLNQAVVAGHPSLAATTCSPSWEAAADAFLRILRPLVATPSRPEAHSCPFARFRLGEPTR